MIAYSLLNSSLGTNGTCPSGRPAVSSGTPLLAYMPKYLRSAGSDGFQLKYLAGMIWSVSMLSPST